MNRFYSLIWIASLLLAWLYTPQAAASTFLGERARFHYIEQIYDRNDDGKADWWIRKSYNGDMIHERKDNNWDGTPDEIVEIVTIKKVIIQVKDENFDNRPDFILYQFSEESFLMLDVDRDGVCDTLHILDSDSGKSARRIALQVSCDPSLQSLTDILKAQNLSEALATVRGQMTERYRALADLFQKASDQRTNTALWAHLIHQTRAYLDLPNNDAAPTVVEIVEEKNSTIGASHRSPNRLVINTANITSLENWLEVIDHEFVHMIQHMRLFSHFRRDGLDWKTYAETPKYQRAPFGEALALYTMLHLYLAEAEAYLHNGQRALYYTPALEPSLEFVVNLKRAEALAFNMPRSRIDEVAHFIVSEPSLSSAHQKILFGPLYEQLNGRRLDISHFDKRARTFIEEDVARAVRNYEKLGRMLFNAQKEESRDFWAGDQKAYIQMLEEILLRRK